MKVTVYGQLRAATGEKTVSVPFDGGSVQDALDAFTAEFPRAKRHLYREDGSLEPSVRVARDGEAVDAGDSCPADARLSVHPAMQGG